MSRKSYNGQLIKYEFFYFSGQITPAVMPQFLFPLENHTVIQGRDISFTCVVEHLQGYKVLQKESLKSLHSQKKKNNFRTHRIFISIKLI